MTQYITTEVHPHCMKLPLQLKPRTILRDRRARRKTFLRSIHGPHWCRDLLVALGLDQDKWGLLIVVVTRCVQFLLQAGQRFRCLLSLRRRSNCDLLLPSRQRVCMDAG